MENKLKIKINRAYYAMKDRCYNPKYNKYKNYGGRGIKVCDEWLRDENNKMLRMKQNKPEYEATLIKYMNYICKNPSGQIKIILEEENV